MNFIPKYKVAKEPQFLRSKTLPQEYKLNLNANFGLIEEEKISIENLKQEIKKLTEENIRLKQNNSEIMRKAGIFRQNYEKEIKQLKEENASLNQEIIKLKEDIVKLRQNKTSEDIEKIKQNYEIKIKELNRKLTTLTNMSTGFSQNDNIVTTLFPGERAMSVLFMTMGSQDIQNYAMTCKNTDLFVTLEEKLYMDYPQYKNCETYFLVNSKRVKRFKTIEENNIKSNDIISLFICE